MDPRAEWCMSYDRRGVRFVANHLTTYHPTSNIQWQLRVQSARLPVKERYFNRFANEVSQLAFRLPQHLWPCTTPNNVHLDLLAHQQILQAVNVRAVSKRKVFMDLNQCSFLELKTCPHTLCCE